MAYSRSATTHTCENKRCPVGSWFEKPRQPEKGLPLKRHEVQCTSIVERVLRPACTRPRDTTAAHTVVVAAVAAAIDKAPFF